MNDLRTGWGVKVAMSLRHRSALSAQFSSSNKANSAPATRARRNIAAAAHWEAEALEQRVMLTTLMGGGSTPANPEMPGDRFVFINEDGNFQTIQLFGNITAEVIGANIDGNNNITLENLPGQLNGGDVNGGFNIPGGATLVGTLNVNNPGGPAITAVPSSIAADPNGNLFGIVIQTVTVPPVPPRNHGHGNEPGVFDLHRQEHRTSHHGRGNLPADSGGGRNYPRHRRRARYRRTGRNLRPCQWIAVCRR